MIKILLLVGGVWFSLALLFVGALFAAHSKSFPKRGLKPAPKSQSIAKKAILHPTAATRTGSGDVGWEMEKPVEA
jgi:hypothetical protein